MEGKKDCFAWKEGSCKVLNETYCKKEECSFYRCNEEYRAKTNEMNERLKRKENEKYARL